MPMGGARDVEDVNAAPSESVDRMYVSSFELREQKGVDERGGRDLV